MGLHPAWWTAILVAVIGAVAVFTPIAFDRNYKSYATVTLNADRSGLIMDPYAKVKYRGVQVGRVRAIRPGNPVRLELEFYTDQLKFIPENVRAQITAPTAFGAKYVELLPPEHPSSTTLKAGAVLHARKVSDEVNTTFGNLVEVLDRINVTKLNAILTALADGFRGKGEQIGEATTASVEYLAALNERADTIREDWRTFKEFNDTYAAAAQNILRTLDAASTTSVTIADKAKQLDALLLSVIGVSVKGIDLFGPNKDNFIRTVNDFQSTSSLLMKYSPTLTCTFLGAKVLYDMGFMENVGGNGYSVILDAGLLFGDDPYKYPDHLPIVGQKGGPGGKPGCGSLPDASKNFPVRYVVTNSGWGTGDDIRINPGIGFPGWSNYFPVTRAVPEPPSINRIDGGPAPGPIPYPGAPPWGARQYAEDGTPLYPGLPPAPPPGRPREPGPTPGAEPFTPAVRGLQPTPNPLPPPPPVPAPAP